MSVRPICEGKYKNSEKNESDEEKRAKKEKEIKNINTRKREKIQSEEYKLRN